MGAIGFIALIAGVFLYSPIATKTRQYAKEGNMAKVKEGKEMKTGMLVMIGTGLLLIFLEFYGK